VEQILSKKNRRPGKKQSDRLDEIFDKLKIEVRKRKKPKKPET
jgi:hypothetical protein